MENFQQCGKIPTLRNEFQFHKTQIFQLPRFDSQNAFFAREEAPMMTMSVAQYPRMQTEKVFHCHRN